MITNINIYSVKQVKETEAQYNCPSVLNGPDEADEAIRAVFSLHEAASETFGFFSLNTKNAIIGAHIVSLGSLTQAVVHPREVFKAAILNNAASIVLFHNHPSENPTPSKDDIEMTKMLVKAGELLGIKVLDHIIVGGDSYLSLAAHGHIG
ncbi:MAG: hypothetical protein DDT32_01670 [Syntrophomonadaceae bacterium]|nr:hypothetical protein [Bacillota bacterium]